MGVALMGMGKRNRNRKLNAAALTVAQKIGPMEIGADGKACEPFDVAKHLTSQYITEKLGL